MKYIINKLTNIKLHQLGFGCIMIIFVCIIKYLLFITPLDLWPNIIIGIFFYISKLAFIDVLENYLELKKINLNLGQIIWGRMYMGNDVKIDTTIKLYKGGSDNTNAIDAASNTGNANAGGSSLSTGNNNTGGSSSNTGNNNAGGSLSNTGNNNAGGESSTSNNNTGEESNSNNRNTRNRRSSRSNTTQTTQSRYSLRDRNRISRPSSSNVTRTAPVTNPTRLNTIINEISGAPSSSNNLPRVIPSSNVNTGPPDTWQVNTIIRRPVHVPVANEPLLPTPPVIRPSPDPITLPTPPVIRPLPDPTALSTPLVYRPLPDPTTLPTFPIFRPLPDALLDGSSRTFAANRGQNITITPDGLWRLPIQNDMSHNNFNCAFELYTKLPTQEIMRDYDRLINNLPHRPFEFLTDAENCAMKVAGCYDVLSDEKRRLLRGFGNHAELSYGLNGRPPILTVQPRLEIRDELIAARPRIIAILNERRF